MAKQNVIMPQMGESIQEGTLTRWHKKVGDRVEREEILFEISTDKVDTEIPSPASGILVELLAQEGQTVSVNAAVAVIDTEGSAAAATPAAPAASAFVATPVASAPTPVVGSSTASATDSRVAASPLARKVAHEHAVDLGSVQGTGLGNKIVKDDVLAAVSAQTSLQAAAPVAAKPAATAAPVAFSTSGTGDMLDGVRVERVAMSPMRKKIAEHMVMSKHTSPHVTSVIEVDLQKVVDLRNKFKDKFESVHGTKLTFMPFFMQAAIEAIKAVPIVNASVDGGTIIYKKDVNLGIAVALDWGLIVPVIKNATEKNFVGLAKDLNQLAEKARLKKLSPDDVRGGTFSITNYGGFGTLIGQPIINQPQVAIFGIGAMQKKPVVINDAIAIRTTCYCVLSFDHRVIDGSDSGKFLSTVKKSLEEWSLPLV